MKKKEFESLLKEKKHNIMKELNYMTLITVIYSIAMLVLIYLQSKNIIPGITSLIFIGILILVAIPVIITDLKRDKTLKKMHKYYLEKNEILDVKDSIKVLKIVLTLLVVIIIIIGTIITLKYLI